MCIIIDVNIVKDILTGTALCFSNIHDSLTSSKRPSRVIMNIGGRLRREYLRVDSISRLLVQLKAAGRARFVPDNDVDKIETELKKNPSIKSNDHHIIALALASKARILCTAEKHTLIEDFTNPKILNPRGKIYKNKTHNKLLRERC